MISNVATVKDNMTEEEFYELSDLLRELPVSEDGYIPTEEEIELYILPNVKKYILYVLFLYETFPKTTNEQEKKIKAKLFQIIQDYIEKTLHHKK